jgi:hypothetical protein
VVFGAPPQGYIRVGKEGKHTFMYFFDGCSMEEGGAFFVLDAKKKKEIRAIGCFPLKNMGMLSLC